MPDLSERIREHVDGVEPPVTVVEVLAVVGGRREARRIARKQSPWRQAAALVTVAVVATALVLGVVFLWSPAKVNISASTPMVLDVPATPKLAVKIPSNAISRNKINWAKVPSYVPLYSGSVLIGYLKKTRVEHPPLIAAPVTRLKSPLPGTHACAIVASNSPQIIDVFNRSHMLIGQIYPNSGFVRLGEQPACNW